ncbi:MAG: AAA family ATPase [Dokdonella sp.]|nr:AAA family ATPase [Dokdonella sp.]
MNTDPHATEPSFAKPPVGVPMPAVPIIVAVMGLPGAGKSIAARALEEHLGLRRICRDTIRAAMFPGGGDSFIEKRAAWRSLLLGLEINCMLGIGSAIDGAYLLQTQGARTRCRNRCAPPHRHDPAVRRLSARHCARARCP